MSTNPNPYEGRPAGSYWRSGVAEADPTTQPGFYTKKFELSRSQDFIATAGSCFAQHIGRHLKSSGFQVLNREPAPAPLPKDQHARFGYEIYSARYGNVYTARQLVQLIKEAHGDFVPGDVVWRSRGGMYFDALRPSVEPDGLESPDEVVAHRRYHLEQVRGLLRDMNVLVFTLGLTETWMHRASGTVYPTAPGTVAGTYDPSVHEFKNFTFNEVVDDLREAMALLHRYRNGKPIKYVLTVSPVPLTATASDKHVLQATVYSKAVLRAAAGQIADESPQVDYFPSYEIISNPWSSDDYYLPNKRSVRAEGVERVMSVFFAEHGDGDGTASAPASSVHTAQNASVPGGTPSPPPEDVMCDEALLEAFGPRKA